METKLVKLTQVKVNKHNPRTITQKKMEQLIVSLLVLPSMLELRPVVVDNKMTALGGNMRTEALNRIAKMSLAEIQALLEGNKDYQRKTDGEKNALLSYWGEWLRNPTCYIAKADKLSEAEKKQFMITDNASFGQWDYDMLANDWDNDDLKNWGVDVWQPEHPDFGGQPSTQGASSTGQPSAGVDVNTLDENDLPPELQGQDLSPDNLPKIEGSDETALERIIIVYPKERKEELALLLGLETIDKIVYNMTELTKDE